VLALEAPLDIKPVRPLMRIFIRIPSHGESLHTLMRVMVLAEWKIIIMAMAAVAEAQASDELLGFGNFVDWLQIAASIDKGEGLDRTICAGRGHGHIVVMPMMAADRLQLPAGRHTILKNRKLDLAVAGVHVMRAAMAMMVPVIMIMIIAMGVLGHIKETLPVSIGAPDHPEGNADDDQAR